MTDILKKFGRYFLLDRLAQGGMAEIYRARLASYDGAGRLIVIKRIQASFGFNADYLQMFKSEIKVTMGFSHPNIVQLYDFGEEDGQPYIAMELVDGKNLKQFIARSNEIKQTFPIELAAHIIEQAASALQYAHSFKDKITGTPLNIVHRDISPQNVLISFEGNVKIIDFGIAKATTNSESTRAGVIKGKPSYLSPEQISGEVLDGRSDLFSLGAVLWELLTGKKLFAGENDLAVLKLIESCQTYVKPPSTLNSKVPKELDYIVLKTLTKYRDKRYQTAEELQRALHKFLYSFMPEFNPSDLGYYAKDLFKNEIVEDRKRIQRLNEKVEQLLSIQTGSTSSSVDEVAMAPQADSTTTAVDTRLRSLSTGDRDAFVLQSAQNDKVEIELTPTHGPSSLRGNARSREVFHSTSSSLTSKSNSFRLPSRSATPSNRAKNRNSSFTKIIISIIFFLIILSLFGPQFGVSVPYVSDFLTDWLESNEARLVLQGDLKGVSVTVNGQRVANSLPAILTDIPVGTPFRVTVTSSTGTFQQDVTLRKGEKKSMPVSLTPISTNESIFPTNPNTTSSGEKRIALRLNILPVGGNPEIDIQGRTIDAKNPIAQVPLDEPLELSINRQGYKPLRKDFVLDSKQMNGLKEWLMDVHLEPLHFGYLTIHTVPSADATIFIEGTPWKKKTPIENEKLPVGNYSIRLTNDVLGMEKEINVSIQEGKAVNLDTRLEIK